MKGGQQRTRLINDNWTFQGFRFPFNPSAVQQLEPVFLIYSCYHLPLLTLSQTFILALVLKSTCLLILNSPSFSEQTINHSAVSTTRKMIYKSINDCNIWGKDSITSTMNFISLQHLLLLPFYTVNVLFSIVGMATTWTFTSGACSYGETLEKEDNQLYTEVNDKEIVLTQLSIVKAVEDDHRTNSNLKKWCNANLLRLDIFVLPAPKSYFKWKLMCVMVLNSI